MEHAEEITYLDVYTARHRLRQHLPPTPLIHSAWLSDATGATVHLKVESVQSTRAFKIRGALNAVLKLAEHDHAPRVIVTASAGNHGRAIAVAAQQLGMRAIVFAPATAPETKKAAIRRHGAELRLSADYDEAEHLAHAFAEAEAAVYISPYNHPDVIAGNGTIGIELLESLPQVDVVIVPLGGGGLASGVAIGIKGTAPQVRVVGVEVEASTPFSTGIARGAITRIEVRPSLADGLTGNLDAGSTTFDLVKRHVDRIVTVGEGDLARAMRGLAAEEHLIAEGAGAAATAAVLSRDVVRAGERAAVLLTGGNIDVDLFASVLARQH